MTGSNGGYSRRRLLQTTAVVGSTLAAGCNFQSGEIPTLQQAYFRVDAPDESGSADIRFALQYDGPVTDGLRQQLTEGELLQTDPEVQLDDTPLDWATPYQATANELEDAITQNTAFIEGEREVDTQTLVDQVQSMVPGSDDAVGLDFPDRRTVQGTIRDAVAYDLPVTGRLLEVPAIRYTGPTVDGLFSALQFPDGFVYRLPFIRQSFPFNDATYGLTLDLDDTNDQRLESVSVRTNDTQQSFPLGVPYQFGAIPTLVPNLTHRFDRTLSALRAASDRRRMALGLASLQLLTGAEGVTIGDHIHPRTQRAYDGDGLGGEMTAFLETVFPTTTSVEGALLYATAISTFMTAAVVTGGATGVIIWTGATWLFDLYGIYQSAQGATESLDAAFGAMQELSLNTNIEEPLAGDPTDELDVNPPPLFAVESLATLQTDYATASLALADPATVGEQIDSYRRLLETQQAALTAIISALRGINQYGGLNYDRYEMVDSYLATQRDGIDHELELLDRFETHVANRPEPRPETPEQTATAEQSTDEPVTVVSLDPTASYKRLDAGDDVPAPDPVVLDEYDIQPGAELRLRTVGNYTIGPSNRERCAVIGVFSRTDEVVGGDRRDRIPGAVDAGEDYPTVDTLDNERATDIPEDFLVSGDPENINECTRRETAVTVPFGAEYLFLAVEDDRYRDNTGDIRVEIHRQ